MPIRFTDPKQGGTQTINEPERPSWAPAAEAAYQYVARPAIKGAREAIKGGYNLASLATTILTNGMFKEPLPEGVLEKGLQALGLEEPEMMGKPLPGSEALTQATGRFGRIYGGGGFLNPAVALGATGAGEAAKGLGLGETGQNIAEIAASLRGAGPGAPVQQTGKIAQPRIVTRGTPVKQAGSITKNRLTQQVNRVNEEAAELAKNIGQGNQKFQKITGSIERNEPIQARFNKFFTDLENYTHANNQPLQNIKPMANFLSNEARLYQQTGAPTDLGKFVMGEINGWRNEGSDNFYNMFRRYRLNNQRIGEIGRDFNIPSPLRNQQISFLRRMNDAIGETFRENLPKDNPWLQAFEQSNEAYSSYKNTEQAREVLQPLLQKSMTPAKAQQFLDNDRYWEGLTRFLGKEEVGSMRQILQDLIQAQSALKSMQRFPEGMEFLRSLAPGIALKEVGLGKIAALLQFPKAYKWALGKFYSDPSFQGNWHEFVQALAKRNLPAALQAARKLGEPEEEKKERPKIRATPA